MKRLAIAAALLLALPIPSALADTVQVDDPRDSGKIDVATATHSHGSVAGGVTLRYTVVTYNDWTSEDLSVFRFTFKRRQWETRRYLQIRPEEDGTLTATMWADRRFRGFAHLTRPDARTLQIDFPKSLLGRGFSQYRWSLYANQHSVCDAHPPDQCGGLPPDNVPDTGTVLHAGI